MGVSKPWLLGTAVILTLMITTACDKGPPWESYMEAGKKAYKEGNLPEAEKQFAEAVKKAEQFGPSDLRLATSLNNLGESLRSQGKLTEAEPMYKRSMTIREQNKDGDQQELAFAMNNLA